MQLRSPLAALKSINFTIYIYNIHIDNNYKEPSKQPLLYYFELLKRLSARNQLKTPYDRAQLTIIVKKAASNTIVASTLAAVLRALV